MSGLTWWMNAALPSVTHQSGVPDPCKGWLPNRRLQYSLASQTISPLTLLYTQTYCKEEAVSLYTNQSKGGNSLAGETRVTVAKINQLVWPAITTISLYLRLLSWSTIRAMRGDTMTMHLFFQAKLMVKKERKQMLLCQSQLATTSATKNCLNNLLLLFLQLQMWLPSCVRA